MYIIDPIKITDPGSFTRASTGTYYDSDGVVQTAAVDVPRFDYDPSDLTAAPELLIEAEATNVAQRSEELDNGFWSPTRVTVTPNATTAPDDASTADLITEDSTASATHLLGNAASFSVTANQNHALSVWVQSAIGGRTRCRLVLSQGGDEVGINADLAAGTITEHTTGSGIVASSEIESCPNNWFRISVAGKCNATGTTLQTVLYLADDTGNITYDGNGAASMYAWGIQLENDTASATSYIPTTSASVTRSADVNNAMLVSNVLENDHSTWAASTTYATGDRVIETSSSSTVTISIASPCVVTWTAHGRAPNTAVAFTTTGGLPSGITAGVEYYVIAVDADTFKLAEKASGSAMNTFGSQSGTHTARARVHKIYESLAGSRSTVTMTIASPCVVTWTAHGLAEDTRISFTTTGGLPTGLVAGTVYYVLSPATDTFNVAATAGGAAINTSGSQSGTHTATATPAASYNKQPAINTSSWQDLGSTNRWKMFDEQNNTQTENPESIVVTVSPVEIANGVYLGGVEGDSVTVTVTDAIEGLVYSEVQSLILSNSASSFWNWFFKRITRKTVFISALLPMYANPVILITIDKPGGVAKCGMCRFGQTAEVGLSEYGVSTTIKDYSTTQFNFDGTSSTVERGFSKIMSLDVVLDNDVIDSVQNLLANYRQRNVVWVPTDYESSVIYGKFSSFRNVIEGPTHSKMALQIDGVI